MCDLFVVGFRKLSFFLAVGGFVPVSRNRSLLVEFRVSLNSFVVCVLHEIPVHSFACAIACSALSVHVIMNLFFIGVAPFDFFVVAVCDFFVLVFVSVNAGSPSISVCCLRLVLFS